VVIDAAMQKKIESLKREIDSLHVANYVYWNRDPADHPLTDGAAYELRRDRLNEIKSELLNL
jgi:hypothetical protein